MATYPKRGKYITAPNEYVNDNDDQQATSSKYSQHIQKEVNIFDKAGNLVSVITEHSESEQENKDKRDKDVDIQSNDCRTTVKQKMDKKYEDIQCKAIVSKIAPYWKAIAVIDGYVTMLKLSDFHGRYLVLFFYPQNFSEICPSELIALSKRMSEFRTLNTEVVACSVDSYLSHQAWSKTFKSKEETNKLKVTLISDPTCVISKKYGCYIPDLGHALRAHYIIDTKGILRHITMNDLSVGRNVSEILRLLKAFQHTDETETLCPADWNPGDATL